MNYLTSKLLSATGVTHGFGMIGCSLPAGAVFFKTNQMHSDDIARLGNHLFCHPEEAQATEGSPVSTRGILPLHFVQGQNDKIIEADAFVTSDPNIICYVRTADCVPILMCDPKRKVIAAVHAGWRGTAKKIAAKTVEHFVKNFGSDKKDIIAAIGPAIGGECYEVGEDVYKHTLRVDLPHPKGVLGKYFLNLPAINHEILVRTGVPERNIETIPICSHCDTRFASYRRDKSEKNRQVSFILLR